MALRIVPTTLAEANAFVLEHHRHHGKVFGHIMSIGCADGERVCGVAIVGRPVARMLDDGFTAEVTRLATDGTRNACSMLYAAAWRACRAIGYLRLGTYILDTEQGTSLRAAGWSLVGTVKGQSWNRKSRPRVDKHPTQGKLRWEICT